MTTQIAIVLLIIVLMSISFFFEILPLGFTALMVPVLLQGSGILTAKEAWSGFSDTTVITWIGLFIIGAVFAKTSITYRIRTFIRRNTKGSPVKVLAVILLGITALGLMTTATATIAALTPSSLRSARTQVWMKSASSSPPPTWRPGPVCSVCPSAVP